MANTYYDSTLTAQQIDNALKAIDGVIAPENNGKILVIQNGKITPKNVTSVSGVVLESLSVSENGTYTPGTGVNGFDEVYVDVPGSATLQSKTVTPSASQQTVQPDSGYDGLSSVVVNGDADLVAGNIKKNVEIFGVTGTYEGGGGEVEPALPSEYQRVEYLDFTPSIGILVTIPTLHDIMWVVEFESRKVSGESVAFGYRGTSTSNKDFAIGADGDAIESYIRSQSITTGITLANGFSYTVGTKATSKIVLISPRNIAMIGKYAHYNTEPGEELDGKFYSLKGEDLDTSERAAWFVPCYRKADNKVGVYDHIAQVFYYETYTSGSGYNIVAGPDVN